MIEHSRGHLDAAEDAFRAALKIREAIGDRAGTMQSLNLMGIILFERGDRDASEAAWRACLQEARKMADRRTQTMVLNNLGESLASANKLAEARTLLLEAQGLARDLADKRGLAEVERNLGLVALALDDDQAQSILDRALVLAREGAAKGLKPRARIMGWAVAGVDPKVMGLGPIPAVRALCARLGVTPQSFDVVESNEAFAAQALAVSRALDLDPARVNPNGGAIALGHPVGATGAILTVKALHELERTGGKTALITMCIGGGQGIALAIERA